MKIKSVNGAKSSMSGNVKNMKVEGSTQGPTKPAGAVPVAKSRTDQMLRQSKSKGCNVPTSSVQSENTVNSIVHHNCQCGCNSSELP
jgi:hypothetical protein